MYCSTVVAFAALPFLVGAVPASLNSPRTDGLISIPLSRRSTHLNGDGSVDLENLQAGAHHTMARLDQAFSAYERNTGEPHPLAMKRGHLNERRIFVPVNLTGATNLVMGEIQVGTPAQAFSVHFDTISPDMFLSGPSCSTCKGHKIYDPSASSTANQTDQTRNQTSTVNFQGLDKVSGSLFFDQVSVAGFKVTNQDILVASDIGPAFQSPTFPADGVLGLGFEEVSAIGFDSYFGRLLKEGGIVDGDQVFGLYLAESGSELVIGGTDTRKFSGGLTFVAVANTGFWQIPFDYISVNGNNISVTTNNVILDTSSIFISSDGSSISNLYANIPGSAQVTNSSQWTIPCNTSVTISVAFNGTTFNIPPSAYNLGPVLSGSSACVGGFSVSEGALLRTWMFGTAFLRNVYTQFEPANRLVGLAPIAASGRG